MAQPLMPHATAAWLVDNTSLSFEQIAEVMNLSRQSVYNLLQKSLGSLRKHYHLSP